MNIISTWIHLDSKEDESIYPQMLGKGKSSDKRFQQVYWECVVVFFATSLRFNRNAQHVLFTNTTDIPSINGFNVQHFFEKNQIEVIVVENKYKVPKDYYGSWNNQFYEFSIIEYIANHFEKPYNFLMLDSDCVFNSAVSHWFKELEHSNKIAFTYGMTYNEQFEINGLSRIEMRDLFNELDVNLDFIPIYSGGEVLFAKSNFLDNIANDFPPIWKILMRKHQNKEAKFNEEAHILSYFYYKYNTEIGKLNTAINRCWTNPFSFRNIVPSDKNLDILHLPAEKKMGIHRVFEYIKNHNGTLDNISPPKYDDFINMLLSGRKYYFSLRNLISYIFNNRL